MLLILNFLTPQIKKGLKLMISYRPFMYMGWQTGLKTATTEITRREVSSLNQQVLTAFPNNIKKMIVIY